MLFCSCIKNSRKQVVQDTTVYIQWEAALRNCQHDGDLVKELFGYMVSGLAEHRINLLKEYENGDNEKISHIAHRIKGDSATLACEDLTSLAAILQKEPYKKQNLDNLIKSIDKTIEYIKKRYPECAYN